MKIIIRPAKISDAPDLARINVTGWQIAYREIIGADLLKQMSLDKRTEQFKQAINNKTEDTYVIEDIGKIIGFTTIGACRDNDRDKNTGEIWGIYIDSAYWMKGYGRKLAEFGEDILIKRGFKEIVLWTLKDNDASRRFYEKIGYRLEGKTKKLEKYGNVEIVRYIKTISRS